MIAREIQSAFGKDLAARTFTNSATPLVAATTPIVKLASGTVAAAAADDTAALGVLLADAAANGEAKIVVGHPGISWLMEYATNAPTVGEHYAIATTQAGVQFVDQTDTTNDLLTIHEIVDSTAKICRVGFKSGCSQL